MRSVILVAAGIVVLCSAAFMAGCDGPEPGTQVKVTDEEIQKRGQGIKDAMKAGMYDNPMQKKAAPAKK
jgi:hypothetical protein